MSSDETWMIVGLGNPGPTYENTRHNVGLNVVEELARRHAVSFSRHRGTTARVAVARLDGGPRVVLTITESFMNVSGGPVSAVSRYYNVPAERIIVVHDDLDLEFGTVRIKFAGGEGGHNGLRDISRALGTKEYVRVRCGIGRPPGRMDPADYVLKGFATPERKEIPLLLDAAGDAAEAVVKVGVLAAQNEVNRRA